MKITQKFARILIGATSQPAIRIFHPFVRQSALLIISLLASASASAANFSVGPVRLSLPISSPSTTVELRSGEFNTPIILQATAYRWEQKDNQRVLIETDALSLSPSVVKLAPGDVQTLLVRAKEKTTEPVYYRLRIEEVANEIDPSGSPQVRFRKTFDLPVFIENKQAPQLLESRMVTSGNKGEWLAEITNIGERHIALSSADVSIDNEVVGSTDMLTYVLPGSRVQMSIPKKESESDHNLVGTPLLRLYNMKAELIETATN